MNTDTPETDQWETYCDECYYHMWRLRRKTERGWHDGVHINTEGEAKGLCDLLNNLERERDEAREDAARWESSSDTLERAGAEQCRRADKNREWALKAEKERDEARGQRDRLAELHNKNAIHFNELLELCGTLRKGRDRLAKALQKVVTAWDLAEWLDENDIEAFRESLQSLTPNAKP